MPRWVSENAEPLVLALVLSLVVWLAGVNASDPIEEGLFPDPIPIQIRGPSEGFVTTGSLPTEATLSLRAPLSVWTSLTASDMRVRGRPGGPRRRTHTVILRPSAGVASIRIRSVEPTSITVTIEEQASRAVPVRLVVTGEAAARYRVGDATPSVPETTVTGPTSSVNQVVEAVAAVPLSGQDSTVLRTVDLTPRNAAGIDVRGVTLTPRQVSVQVPISLPGGFRSVAVIPLVTGQVLPGYYVTNMTVSPPTVTVFSSNPTVMESLPGFRTDRTHLPGRGAAEHRTASDDRLAGRVLARRRAVGAGPGHDCAD